MPYEEKDILPQYPRTMHVPWKPNLSKGDAVADNAECRLLFNNPNVCIEEKVDGAQCGMAFIDGEPLIRNRNHILSKGFVKDTPAKKQFSSVWNWFYDNKELFERLNEVGPLSVYGDWCIAQHGLLYDKLPTWFITYDLYNWKVGKFMDSRKAKKILKDIGFHVVPELHTGPIDTWEQLEELSNRNTVFATDTPQEGVYIKVSDGQWITDRFKLVRESFVQGALWDTKKYKKNKIAK